MEFIQASDRLEGEFTEQDEANLVEHGAHVDGARRARTAPSARLWAEGRRVRADGPNATSITITPVFVADLSVEGERMPVYVHVIDHPDARVLVDTMTELHPAMADMDPASGR